MDTTASKWELKGKLASKVAAAVFLSIVIIEAVILVPSYFNYERDLLLRLERVGRASFISAFRVQSHATERDLPIFGKLIARKGEVVGGSFHHPDGRYIGRFGNPPEIKPRKELKSSAQLRSADGQWLDVVWPATETNLPWTIVGRLDARWVSHELQMFLWRILGLVLLISFVVCGATVLILHFLVLQRVRSLCKWLLGIDFNSENTPDAFPDVDKNDELGQMALMLHDTVDRAAGKLSQIRDDRAALDEANYRLERIIQDRTRELRVSRDTAELANRAKTEFLAHMSHELRTPLNAILGFSEILKGQMFGPLGNDKYTEYVAGIGDAGEHLTHIIGDILDVSQVEMGELEIYDDEVELLEIASDCTAMVRERAFSAKIDLSMEVEKDLPNMRADGRRVKQILLNLLSNAIKFTPEKGKVGIHAGLGPNNGIVLRVSDTGIGIPEEDIADILKPFGQVKDAYTSTSQEGVGLGLPLVKSLTELHGGTLDIDSTPGKGTSVSVAFPPERTIQAGRSLSERAAS